MWAVVPPRRSARSARCPRCNATHMACSCKGPTGLEVVGFLPLAHCCVCHLGLGVYGRLPLVGQSAGPAASAACPCQCFGRRLFSRGAAPLLA